MTDTPNCNCTLCQLCAARARIEQSRDFDELLKYCDNVETLWLNTDLELQMTQLKTERMLDMTLGEFRKETANLPDHWKIKMLTEEGEYVADVNTVDRDGNEVLLVE